MDEPHADAQVAMLIATEAADNDNQISVEQVRRQLAEEYPLAAVPFDDYVERARSLSTSSSPSPLPPPASAGWRAAASTPPAASR